MSNKLRYGGPGVLFKGTTMTRLTPDGNILVANTNNNSVKIVDKSGKEMKRIRLEEYKPIFRNIRLTASHIILSNISKRDDYGYATQSRLLLFDWKGKKVGEKTVPGLVMGLKDDKLLLRTVDQESDEHFKVVPFSFKK